MKTDTINQAQTLLNQILSTVNSDVTQSFNRAGYGSVRHTLAAEFTPEKEDTLIKLIDNAQFFSDDEQLPQMLEILQSEKTHHNVAS
jgi:hypothetical protein